MHILIWIAIGAVLIIIFMTSVRDFFAATWNIICGTAGRLWDFLRGAGPAAGAAALTTGVIIGRILLFVALAVILFITILYVTLGAGIMAAGIITGHWKAALLLLTALLFWGSLSVVPSIGMFRPLTIASRYVVRPIVVLLSIYLIICTGWWTIGKIAPEMRQSADRLMGNGSAELVDLMDSKSIETEGKLGKIGRIDMDGVVGYSPDGETTMPIPKGKRVRLATEFAGVKITKASAVTVWVMLENNHGDFFRGKVFLIPPNRVNWEPERTDAEAKAKAEAAKAAVAVQPPPAPSPQPKTQAPQSQPEKVEIAQAPPDLRGSWKLSYLKNQQPITLIMVVEEAGNSFRMTSRGLVFIGEKTRNQYKGNWKEADFSGTFDSLVFSEKSATGRFISSGGKSYTMNLHRI